MDIKNLIKANFQLFVIFFFAGILACITIVLLVLSRVDNPSPSITREAEKQFSEILHSTVNKTTEAEVEKIKNRKLIRRLEGNVDEYSFSSVSKRLNSIIVTKDDVVIFEKKITIAPDYTHPILTQYLNKLGFPEETLHGSYLYGSSVDYYIYASKGITIVGRPYSDEVQEIHSFVPMTVAEYINTWGKDLVGYKEPEHEGL